jgi:hypothetical protein
MKVMLEYDELNELGKILTNKYKDKIVLEGRKIDRFLVYNKDLGCYEVCLQQLNDEKEYQTLIGLYFNEEGDCTNIFYEKKYLNIDEITLIKNLRIYQSCIGSQIMMFINSLNEENRIKYLLPQINIGKIELDNLPDEKLYNMYREMLIAQETIKYHLRTNSEFSGNLPQNYIFVSLFVENMTREEILHKLNQLKEGDFDGLRMQ